jgi:hypothetical protein
MAKLTPREKELLQGMCNCYSVCGADFEGTVSMVGGARGLSSAQVKDMLAKIKETYGKDQLYVEMRKKLPRDFPM